MIGILDFIYFPFLNKYIKRHIHSFILFKHHLLDDVHQTLTRFYSSSYHRLIKEYNTFNSKTNIVAYGYASSITSSLSYLTKYKKYTIDQYKQSMDVLTSYLIYNHTHPLHKYLQDLWISGNLSTYYDYRIEIILNILNDMHNQSWNIVRFTGGTAYSN
jgi:hypothetical protein